MKMWIYIVRRGVLLFPVIVGVMTITFAILAQLPVTDRLTAAYGIPKGGWHPFVPCSQLGLPNPPNQTMCPDPTYWNAIHRLGLDKPLIVQWAIYMGNSLILNWGSTSPHSAASGALGLTGSSVLVATVLSWYLPYTLELAAIALLFTLALAIPLGNYSAVYRNRPLDQGTRVMSFSGFALPPFLLATLVLFGVLAVAALIPATYCNGLSTLYEQWTGSWPPPVCFTGGAYPSFIGPNQQTSPTGFPTLDAAIAGYYSLSASSVVRMLIPALVIAFTSVAGILRFVRNSMLEVMGLDFIRTARATGVPEGTLIRRHAGRHSLNVTITVLGLTFAFFLAGFPIIEQVYQLEGIGRTLVYAIQPQFDYGLIFGTTLLFTIIVVAANLIVDVLYAYLDPRVRLD